MDEFGYASSMNAESFEAESNFDKLANKIAAQYRAKGKSPAEAERIGKATAAKIGFKKYGKAGMRTKAMRGRMAKGAEGTGGKKSMIPTVITFTLTINNIVASVITATISITSASSTGNTRSISSSTSGIRSTRSTSAL